MEPWVERWLDDQYGKAAREAGRVRIDDFGVLPLTAEVAVWHPLDDLYSAPRFEVGESARIHSVRVAGELAAFLVAVPGEIVSWREVGDPGTSTDRFFLVQVDQSALVVDWFNEDPRGFEELGGDCDPIVQVIEHRGGSRVVVIHSPDGNAVVTVGCDAQGDVVGAVIDVR